MRITIDGEPLDVAWKKTIDAAGAVAKADESKDEDDERSPPPARAFSLRSSRAYAPDPRASSRVWGLLDANADGRLDASELAVAAARLWSRDANDDRIIDAAELAPLRDQLDRDAASTTSTQATAGSSSARLAAIQLNERTNWERIDFTLQDLYAPLQDLSAESFTALPRLFAALDANGDAVIGADELPQLATMAPALELAVAFDGSAATVRIDRHDAELAALPDARPDRMTLQLGIMRLIVSAHDLSAALSDRATPTPAPDVTPDPSAGQRVRLMIHDRQDSLFGELDANADGRLGEREIARAAERLQNRDGDHDGTLADAEAPYVLVAAFLRGEASDAPPFVMQPPLTSTRPAVAPPTWFSPADLNRDGDVSRREFLGSPEQFAALDSNEDQFIDASEAAAAGDSAAQ